MSKDGKTKDFSVTKHCGIVYGTLVTGLPTRFHRKLILVYRLAAQPNLHVKSMENEDISMELVTLLSSLCSS